METKINILLCCKISRSLLASSVSTQLTDGFQNVVWCVVSGQFQLDHTLVGLHRAEKGSSAKKAHVVPSQVCDRNSVRIQCKIWLEATTTIRNCGSEEWDIPSTRSVVFRRSAAARSLAPSCEIWLLRKSSTCSFVFELRPSQNAPNALSIIPTAFHSKQRLDSVEFCRSRRPRASAALARMLLPY